MDLFIFFILIIFDIFEYGTEYDPDLILPGMKKFFYIQFPGTMHIVCRSGLFSIDIDMELTEKIEANFYSQDLTPAASQSRQNEKPAATKISGKEILEAIRLMDAEN